ncbi:MAG: glycoside hydrolase family 5 protein [Treponema sp.]|uniref:glycoside hydrolase family 5 protein n=1 Tax=Treponema sp. TaxID=166 RepID=UPI001B71C374|nr:glycoside hydrolase family 5 protein [Treponema sp.]MBP5402098.1 glycoside hydrolase family 5 protein [Treponema sp.]MBR5933433.1 glycoside hydrolase family 5 protein [Treponema sp.]
MKKIKCIFLAFAILVLGMSAIIAQEKNDGKEIPRVNVTMPFSKGLNLSNWLELHRREYSNIESEFFGKQDFIDIKSLGVEIIRIPIHFEEMSSDKPDFIIEDWLWEKIDNAVEWCTELKMYMIIDFHNDCGGNSKTRPDVEDMLIKIWTQIAERYKDSGEYVLYEIMNEPHFKSSSLASDISKWNKIQGNVLKKIRQIDKTHTVIVGGADWHSINSMLQLPDYKDSNIILNFHDYTPFLFTHQGANWVGDKGGNGLENVRHIPFPYSKEKMPQLPKNQIEQDWIEYLFSSYEKEASEANLVKPLNEAVKLANKRGVALMCNEWGTQMNFADEEDRINWYRLKAKWMDERNIIRLSWDYKNSFGVFNDKNIWPGKVNFPEDLNKGIVEALGFKVPEEKKRVRLSWLENAKRTGDYTIYKNGFVKGILLEQYYPNYVRVNKRDDRTEDSYIYFGKTNSYERIEIPLGDNVDLSSFVDSGKFLEFEIRTNQKKLSLEVYFEQKEILDAGKSGLPWRCRKSIKNDTVPADGQWHIVRIPLKDFADIGAWVNRENKWYNGEGLFSWKRVHSLIFDVGEKGLQGDLSVRNIAIK